MKKLLSLLLTFALLMSCLPGAFAVEANEAADSVYQDLFYLDETLEEIPTEEASVSGDEVSAEPEAVSEDEIGVIVEETCAIAADTYVMLKAGYTIYTAAEMVESLGTLAEDSVVYVIAVTEDGALQVAFAQNSEVLCGFIAVEAAGSLDEDALNVYFTSEDTAFITGILENETEILLTNCQFVVEIPIEDPCSEEPAEEASEEVTESASEEVTSEDPEEEAEEEITVEGLDDFEDGYLLASIEKREAMRQYAESLGFITEKAYWYDKPTDFYYNQIAKDKLYISWKGNARSYLVYEVFLDYEDNVKSISKRGVAIIPNDSYIIISGVKPGVHFYAVFTCELVGGKGELGNFELIQIEATDQAWRDAPKITAVQNNEKEVSVNVSCSYLNNSIGYILGITENGNERYVSFDLNGHLIKSVEGDITYEDDCAVIKTDESTFKVDELVLDKAAATWNGKVSVNGKTVGTTVKFRMLAVGYTNDQQETDFGKWSGYKSVKIIPQWSLAPKITEIKQNSAVAPNGQISWTYTGVPEYFRIYDGKTCIKDNITPSGTHQQTLSLNNLGEGSHSLKVVAVKNGIEGKYSGAKSLKIKITWKTTKLKLTATQPAENKVKLSWEPLAGVTWYYVYEIVSGIKEPVIVDYTTGSSYTISNVTLGKHTYVVCPWYKNELGTYSAKKTISVVELWKIAPTNLNAVVDCTIANKCKIELTWTAPGAPDHYEISLNKKTSYVISASATSTRSATISLDNPASSYSIYVRAIKNGEYGAYSSAKKVSYKYSPISGTCRALIIGNTYTGSSKLSGCKTDAKTMTGLLKSMTTTKYKVTTKYDRTAPQILSDIATAFKGATENDVSLFYYSGHGMGDTGDIIGNKFCMTYPHDYITFAQLRSALDQVPGKKIVLLDSCYSGQAIDKDSISEEELMAEMQNYADRAIGAFSDTVTKSGELKGTDYYVMTACRKNQTSAAYNGSIPFSVFTRFFEEVCGWDEMTNKKLSYMSADTNGDNVITLHEAFVATNAAVENFKRTHSVGQVTRVNPEGSSFVLFGR